MKFIQPFPWCLLNVANRARAYIPAERTDISRTIAEHDPRWVEGWKNQRKTTRQEPQP